MLLPINKIRDVRTPVRAYPTDAGIDFFVPKFTKKFVEDLISLNKEIRIKNDKIILKPLQKVLIPSGISVEIPYSKAGLFANKSSIASKRGLIIGACIIDTFYSGEIHLDLHNVSNKTVEIKEKEKIAQLLIIPIETPEITLVEDKDDLYENMKLTSFRDDGGFGSTNKENK